MRSRLRNHLYESWSKVIETDYGNRRVNSERSLQAAMWSRLNERLVPSRFQVFVEPCFRVVGEKPIYPDLVVTNTRSIIAAIELKYQPRASPSFEKDLRSLDTLARHRNELTLSLERYRGEAASKQPYSFSAKVLFVWAGVHRDAGGIAPTLPITTALAGSFYAMHALTATNAAPLLRDQIG